MSKNRKKRNAGDVKKSQRSAIGEHHQVGKTLIPPLANIPKLTPNSWIDNRLPEMLWATLLITHLPRVEALNVFREVADYINKVKEKGKPSDITHTGLSNFDPEVLNGVLSTVTRTDERKSILRPMLLLEKLPAKEQWEKFLGATPSADDWKLLMASVAKTLNHQSQESTDCRWLRIICMMAAGVYRLPTEEMVKELVYYPEYGDQRHVRPSIRATEMAFSAMDDKKRVWAFDFWAQCWTDTTCFPLIFNSSDSPIVGTTPDKVNQVFKSLSEHFYKTNASTQIEPKHDTVFGIGLYSLGILQELLRIGASNTISARIALRTLSECCITLAYLSKKDNADLWKSYRVFGAGQAKLQSLKFDEMENQPTYVHDETLSMLANEDVWEEFLSIELGHWEKANLRDLSIQSDTKNIYDQFYGWTSTFSHGHWGAIRDSAYDTCANPLHRLHRIPRKAIKNLPDVIPDACGLVDGILEIVAKCYPPFEERVTITINSA